MQKIGNVFTNLFDEVSKQNINLEEVSTYYDGTPMTDTKVDGRLYMKNVSDSKYYRQVLPNWGENFLNVDTMADLRALDDYNLLLVKSGYYKGITLLGYYNKGEYSLNYLWNNTQGVDDGGSVINVGGGSFEASSKGIFSAKMFGVKLENDQSILNNLINNVNINELIFDDLIYKFNINSRILVINGNNKTIKCSNNGELLFNCANSSNYTIFDLQSNIIIKDLIVDFNNGSCGGLVRYNKNYSLVADINNITLKNLKDNYSNTKSYLINIGSDVLIKINGVNCKNLSKVCTTGTEESGLLSSIIVTGEVGDNMIGGEIEKVYVEDIYNFYASSPNNRVYDGGCKSIHIFCLGGYANVSIKNCKALNFGRRFIKLQSSNIDVDSIDGHSDYPNVLSLVSPQSDGGYEHININISNIKATGRMDYCVPISSSKTKVKNVRAFNNLPSNRSSVGILIQNGRDVTIENIQSSSQNILFISTLSGSCSDIKVKDITILPNELGNVWGAYINFGTGGIGSIENLIIEDVKLLVEDLEFSPMKPLFSNIDSTSIFKNIKIKDVKVKCVKNINYVGNNLTFGSLYNINGLTIEDIEFYNNSNEGLVATTAGDFINLRYCTDIKLDYIKSNSVYNRGILIRDSIDIIIGNSIDFTKAPNFGIANIVIGDLCQNVRLSNNQKITYNLNANIQQQLVRYFGTTTQRPTLLTNTDKGFKYFDTTLNKEIIWNGTSWGEPLTTKSTPIANATSADATDLETALVLINELKVKLNAKLEADRASGQQAT